VGLSILFQKAEETMFSRRNFVAAFAALALVLTVTNVSQAQQRGKLQANLTGSTLASGKAKYENRGNRQKFSVEIEDAKPNASYRIEVRSATGLVFRAVVTTNALGAFDLNRDTILGQSVPAITAGNNVTVFDVAARTVILQGRF
jgi:hypothetical protein